MIEVSQVADEGDVEHVASKI
ncbi:MAG: hypothetical protein JWR25_2267, partial [Noviherbaspirillum sp.]|nr:hypothetical protein [Noviherbaspirillum sp.]